MSNPYAPPGPGRGRDHDGRSAPGPEGSSGDDRPGTGDGGTRPHPPGGATAGGPGADRPHGPTGPAGGPPGFPGRPGPGRDEPGRRLEPPADPEVAKALTARVRLFGLLMLATVATSALPLPLSLAAIAFSVGGVVVGVLALVTSWSARVRGALPALIAVGVTFGVLVATSQLTTLAVYDLQLEREQCLREALTGSAREACEAEFSESLTDRVDRATQRLMP